MAARSSLLFLVFSLFLLVVIPIVSSEDKCAPLNKDVKALKDKPYWQFEVSKDLPGCKRFSPPGNVSTTCVFFFSVCNPVPAFCPENSGICLANKFNYRPKSNVSAYTEFHSIGDSIPGPKAFKSEKKNFTLKFGAVVGLPPPLSTNTIITFICNQNASWSDAKDSKVPYPPTVNYTIDDKGEILLYKIEFQYKGACQGGGGGGGGGGGSSDKPTKPLSVGSILLILFFPGIFLYCVVGVLINRGSGKTGKEMIPNSKFWTDLPGLISDGFSFFIAKITCTEMSTSRETYDRM